MRSKILIVFLAIFLLLPFVVAKQSFEFVYDDLPESKDFEFNICGTNLLNVSASEDWIELDNTTFLNGSNVTGKVVITDSFGVGNYYGNISGLCNGSKVYEWFNVSVIWGSDYSHTNNSHSWSFYYGEGLVENVSVSYEAPAGSNLTLSNVGNYVSLEKNWVVANGDGVASFDVLVNVPKSASAGTYTSYVNINLGEKVKTEIFNFEIKEKPPTEIEGDWICTIDNETGIQACFNYNLSRQNIEEVNRTVEKIIEKPVVELANVGELLNMSKELKVLANLTDHYRDELEVIQDDYEKMREENNDLLNESAHYDQQIKKLKNWQKFLGWFSAVLLLSFIIFIISKKIDLGDKF